MKGRFSAVFVLGLLAAVLGCLYWGWSLRQRQLSGSQVILKLGHGMEEKHPVHRSLVFFGEEIAKRSGGRITVDIYSGAVLGGELESVEQVQQGTLSMTKVTTAALEAFMPEITVFGMPFIFDDADHFWRVLRGKTGQAFLDGCQAIGVKGLCYYEAGARSFYSTQKPVKSLADLNGLKVRVMPSRSAVGMIDALGGSPCPINWGELYSALSQGTVDAAENNVPSFVSSRHYEVCNHFSYSEHQRIPEIVMINSKLFNRLPADLQAMIKEVALESSEYERKLWAEEEARSLAQMQKRGVHFYKLEREAFRQACLPFIEQQPEGVKRYLKEIEEARQ